MILTIIAEISNKVEKLAIKYQISNKLLRDTQPSASRDREQLTRGDEKVVLYIWYDCHMIAWS